MTRLRFAGIALLTVLIAIPASARVRAQTLAKPPSASTEPALTLKVTVVLSKVNGEKKLSSLPFVLMVLPGDRTSVQMSSQLPVPQGGTSNPAATPSYTYQNFGTNISAEAMAAENGQFRINLTISDSQMMSETGVPLPDWMKGLTRMQNFTSQTRLLLRDGQNVQWPAATDKFTGDVVKVDVTLNVIK